jgi:hypothetical protein
VQEKLILEIFNTKSTYNSVELHLPELPTVTFGIKCSFELLILVNDPAHIVTFNAAVEWEEMTPYVFCVGSHLIEGFFNPFTSKWALSVKKYGLAVS